MTKPQASGGPQGITGGEAPGTWTALGLGSNLGDRARHLARARAAIETRFGTVLRASRIYESEPLGPHTQPCYLNQVVALLAPADPETMLAALLKIEDRLGRQRTIRWGARTIDIDLLLWGDRVHRGPRATVPHPRLHDRPFVLVPLAELLPHWRHPLRQADVREMLLACDRDSVWPWAPSAAAREADAELHGEG
ncbi:MAG: 2-amino-4-hydroxy-6-hydroxymethyldihydropteridine diphosphokinase [Candidatus Eisenbacteria sp.]|nr:2-amino-4-hydroxy-6-hydroxymethyldihydropteridine diphosphokinase [Candidatus Eisenbacteria bacterium]